MTAESYNNADTQGERPDSNFHDSLSYNTLLALHDLLSGFSEDWQDANSRANLLRLALHSEISISRAEHGFAVHMLEDDYLCLLQAANEETMNMDEAPGASSMPFSDWLENHIIS